MYDYGEELFLSNLCSFSYYFQRKAAHEKKGFIDNQMNDDDNEEDGFMVLDSVGSADGEIFFTKVNLCFRNQIRNYLLFSFVL